MERESETVAVVRCRECKHYKAAVDPITYRPKHICTSPTGLCCDPKAEDFCSYAERKRR